VVTHVDERPPERQLSPDLATEHQLRLGERQIGGDQVTVDRLAGVRAAAE
jgi:hypothetical protein